MRSDLHELTTPPIRVTPYGIETTEVVSPDPRWPRAAPRRLDRSLRRLDRRPTGTLSDVTGVVGAVRQTYGDTAQSLVLEPAVDQLAMYPRLAERVAERCAGQAVGTDSTRLDERGRSTVRLADMPAMGRVDRFPTSLRSDSSGTSEELRDGLVVPNVRRTHP